MTKTPFILSVLMILWVGCTTTPPTPTPTPKAAPQTTPTTTTSPTTPPSETYELRFTDLDIVFSSDDFRVTHPAFGGQTYRLYCYSGQPKLLELRPLPSGHHCLLIYAAGSFGSSPTVHASRAKVINLRTGEEIIDEVWKYMDERGRPHPQVSDPVWTFSRDQMTYQNVLPDPEVIPLN